MSVRLYPVWEQGGGWRFLFRVLFSSLICWTDSPPLLVTRRMAWLVPLCHRSLVSSTLHDQILRNYSRKEYEFTVHMKSGNGRLF